MAVLSIDLADDLMADVPEGWAADREGAMAVLSEREPSLFVANVVALPTDSNGTRELVASLDDVPDSAVLLVEQAADASPPYDRLLFAYGSPTVAVTVDQRIYAGEAGGTLVTASVPTGRYADLRPLLEAFFASVRRR